MIDAATLAEFHEKRKTWGSWLREDKHHSVRKQIAEMVLSDGVFRILNQARTPVDGKPVSATNGILGNFINQGYVLSQIMAVRRLVEKAKDKPERDDVISLPRLLKDIKGFRLKLTRELYVCHDGTPYDAADGPRHWQFDHLSGVTFDGRSPNDIILEARLDDLDHRLDDDCIRKMVVLSNKFVAHAADEKSRAKKKIDSIDLPFETVSKAHHAIISVFKDVEHTLFDTHYDMVRSLPLGAFKGLDLPYASEATIQKFGKFWSDYSKEREKWG